MLPWKAVRSGPAYAPDHQALFAARYDRIRAWARQIAAADASAADDLVHDAFIQFALAQPDLAGIANLDGYLFAMLRNLHLSRLRRLARGPEGPASIIDYDSAELCLRAIDFRQRAEACDALVRVCDYACERKASAKAASALILRFFHGYFPSEIAQLLHTSREAVSHLLATARSEARTYLDAPPRVRTFAEARRARLRWEGDVSDTGRLLAALRARIRAARTEACWSRTRMERLYRGDEPVACDRLAHIVSCEACLDAACAIAGVSPPDDRHPTDTLGPKPTGRGDAGADGEAPAAPHGRSLRRHRRGLQATIEHRAAELRIAVNGFILLRHRIAAPTTEETLAVDVPERVEFVEVFSEQGVRLLFLSVTPPPDGPNAQEAAVALSDGRRLRATLTFDGAWPNLAITYFDPTMRPFEQASFAQATRARASFEGRRFEPVPFGMAGGEPASVEQAPAASRFDSDVTSRASVPAPGVAAAPRPDAGRHDTGSHVGAGSRAGSRARFGLDFGFGFGWLKPLAVGAFMLLLVAAGLWNLAPPRLSGVEVLSAAERAERAVVVPPASVTRRVLRVEERRGGAVVTQRVVVWESAERGVSVRRVYDDRGRLIAGEWRRGVGASTVYRRTASNEATEYWRVDPSVSRFKLLATNPARISVDDRRDVLVLTYHLPEAAPGRVRQAVLTLRKPELRPIGQRFVIRDTDGRLHDYLVSEDSSAVLPARSVGDTVFEPEKELIGTRPLELPPAVTAPPIAATPRAPALSAPAPIVPRAPAFSAYAAVRDYVTRQLAADPAGAGRDRQALIEAAFAGYRDSAQGRSAAAIAHVTALERLVAAAPAEARRAGDFDGVARWHAQVLDHAAAVQREVMSLQTELRPMFFTSIEPSSPNDEAVDRVVTPRTLDDLPAAVERLAAAVRAHDEMLHRVFETPSSASAAPPTEAPGGARQGPAATSAAANGSPRGTVTSVASSASTEAASGTLRHETPGEAAATTATRDARPWWASLSAMEAATRVLRQPLAIDPDRELNHP